MTSETKKKGERLTGEKEQPNWLERTFHRLAFLGSEREEG